MLTATNLEELVSQAGNCHGDPYAITQLYFLHGIDVFSDELSNITAQFVHRGTDTGGRILTGGLPSYPCFWDNAVESVRAKVGVIAVGS